jgi:hypothetical protein
MLRILIACISYIVLTFAIAMIWNMVLFRDIYISLAANSLRSQPIIMLGLLSVMTEAITLSLLFHFYFHHSKSLKGAITLAVSVGIFSVTYASFTVPAKFIIDPIWQYVSLELIFGLFHYGLVGTAFFFIFKDSPAQNTSARQE